MKKLSLQTKCPGCFGSLRISAGHCESCDITIQGRFQTNEFATLSEEDLHFLRIFIFAEGRISQMEGPLGLSYPTIRNRLSQLKEKLQTQAASLGHPLPDSTTDPVSEPTPVKPDSILEQLDRGDIDFNEALKSLRSTKKKKGKSDEN